MIHRQDHDDVAFLRLAHGKVSALDVELLEGLSASLDELERSPARAAVLTGSGRCFSAGVDLFRVLEGGAAYLDRFLPLLTSTFRRLFTFPRPVVAALNGHAIAGGCILAAACDLRVMARGGDGSGGRVGVPELLVGVPFPLLALEILRFATPGARLGELVLGGATWAPDEALRRGLVDELVEPEGLEARALDLARGLAALPAESFRITKAALRRPYLERFERDGARVDAEVAAAWASDEGQAAIRAYLERTLR